MEIINFTLPAALIAGLAFGAGPCNVTCLPYLGPVFLKGEGVRQSWRILLPFTTGRLSGYSILGLAAGLAGKTVTEVIQSSIAGWVLGIAAILVGLQLFFKRSSCSSNTQKTINNSERIQEHRVTFINNAREPQTSTLPGPLFMLGAGMALNPCVPLTAILAAAAASGSATTGLSLGVMFGLGAVVIPSLVFGILIAHFGAELKQQIGSWSRYIEKVSGSLLILLGVVTASGWVQP